MEGNAYAQLLPGGLYICQVFILLTQVGTEVTNMIITLLRTIIEDDSCPLYRGN